MDAAAETRRREHPPAADGAVTRRDASCLTRLTRATRPAWRIFAAAGACALALAAVVAATGGVDWLAGPLRIRVHQPWRLAGSGLALIGLALWLGGEEFRALLVRAWDARERHARWVAAAAAAAAMAVGLVKGTRVAGSADSYGYVSQALLWLKGLPVQAEPLAAAVPWPLAEWSLSPLGYRPGVETGVIVPTYPPGSAARDGGVRRRRRTRRGVLGRAAARRAGGVAHVRCSAAATQMRQAGRRPRCCWPRARCSSTSWSSP